MGRRSHDLVAMDQENNQGLKPEILAPEQDLGRAVAEELKAQFATSRRLLARCERLAGAQRGDRVGPIQAAASLLRANAQLANSVARVASIETRHRSISEVSQSVGAAAAELNSIKPGEEPFDRNKALDALERKLQRLRDFEDLRGHTDFVADAAGISTDDVYETVRESGRSDDEDVGEEGEEEDWTS